MDFRRRLSGIPIKINENKAENHDNCIRNAKLKKDYDSNSFKLSPGRNEKNLIAEQAATDLLAGVDFKIDDSISITTESSAKTKYAILKEEFDGKYVEMNLNADEKTRVQNLKAEQEAVDLLEEGNSKNDGSKNKATESFAGKKYSLKSEFDAKCTERKLNANEKSCGKHLKAAQEATEGDFKNDGFNDKVTEIFAGEKNMESKQEVIDLLDKDFQIGGSKCQTVENFTNTKFKGSGFEKMKRNKASKKKAKNVFEIKNAVSNTFRAKTLEPTYRKIESKDEALELFRYLSFVFLIILYLYWVYKTSS